MKKSTRFLCLLLCCCMAVSLLPGKASAYNSASADSRRRPTISGDGGAGGAMAATTDGYVYTWGPNKYGQLGDGGWENQIYPVKATGNLNNVVSVCFGAATGYAIRTDNSLWAWGYNGYGQVPDGTTYNSNTPARLMEGVAAVSASYHTMVVKTDGSLWVWGKNSKGQVGDGTTETRKTPVHIMDGVVMAAAGRDCSAAIKSDGSLWTWGCNDSGQLGDGTLTDHSSPKKIMDGVSFVCMGGYHGLAVKSDGSLWAWGRGSSGQLGDGTKNSQHAPIKVMDGVSAAAAGNVHSLILKTDGSLWACGSNYFGQLGDGSSTDRAVPVKVLDGVSCVSAGFVDSYALKNDGFLWAWGSNANCQVGNGGGGNYTTTNSNNEETICQTSPVRLSLPSIRLPGAATPDYRPPTIISSGLLPEASGIAVESFTTVRVDGVNQIFKCYALWDASGGRTNYIKVRDLADFLDGTVAQFNVGWDGNINLETGRPYSSRNGTENQILFSGRRPYVKYNSTININGYPVELNAFTLTDDSGGQHNYFQLRDMGQALGFNVGWDSVTGVIYVETDKPYVHPNT